MANEPALMLAPEAPYPEAGGGAIRTASLLEYLSQSREVDLIVFRQPGAPDPRTLVPPGRVRDIFVLDLPPNSRTFAAKALRNAARVSRGVPPLVDRFAGFAGPIAQAVSGRRYGIGIVEHLWCAPYREQIAAVCERTVLDLHNIESLLHERCAATESGPAGFAHRIFRQAARELEQSLLPGFSEVMTTSGADAAHVKAIAPGANVRIYRNAIRSRPIPIRSDEEVIVFSGNMEYHPNISAVRFFRREIWPRLRERWPALIWRLVGKNASAVKEHTSSDPRIEVVGEIDDPIRELARARVAVVPLLAGSGTRLKILEAWAAVVPVVSTSLGGEGLPAYDGEHLLLADSASAFAAAVSRLLACKDLRTRLGSAGRLLMEQEFIWEAAWKNLDF